MKVKEFVEKNRSGIFEALKELCLIPAPSGQEEKRAESVKKTLESFGAEGVYIDSALNVVYPLNCENSDKITVFVGHTDTVFPDTEPMPYEDKGDTIHSPGVADDTASVVAVLMMAKYFLENKIVPQNGILFVLNSCEEGLGNLKGTRQIFKDYEGRIERFFSFDSQIDIINDICVGSERFEVELKTEGGHSYLAFGKKNAISELSSIITKIFEIMPPTYENSKTTFNVGTIEGGTSVNTIAQNAKMLCEYRSDNSECLTVMRNKFLEIFENARTEGVEVLVKNVGERPCSITDYEKVKELINIAQPIIEEVTGNKVVFKSSSTDCNIPLSLGIPAICLGVCKYEGMHTREEFLYKDSLIKGIEIAIKLGLEFI